MEGVVGILAVSGVPHVQLPGPLQASALAWPHVCPIRASPAALCGRMTGAGGGSLSALSGPS